LTRDIYDRIIQTCETSVVRTVAAATLVIRELDVVDPCIISGTNAAKVNVREEYTDAIDPSWAGCKDGGCIIDTIKV
jgi:hypothetical protein